MVVAVSAPVSVIVVTYHTGPVLWPGIRSVLKQEGLHELIVVDNGNPPEVISRLNRLARSDQRVRLLSGHGNVGFARACNIGASTASGEYLLLLNSDSLLSENALPRLVQALNQYPSAMLAGVQLVDMDGKPQCHIRHQLLTPRNMMLESTLLRRLLKVSNSPAQTEVHEVPAVSGACMLLRRDTYQRLGGLDEKYFLHVEDTDLCMRVHKVGGKIIMVPEVKALYFGSTSDASLFFVEWHKWRGFLRYFTTHFSDTTSRVLIAIILPLLFLRGFFKASYHTLRALLPPYTVAMDRRARSWVVLKDYIDEIPATVALEGGTILVTGATGQTGLCIIGRLLTSGAKVIALTRKTDIPFYHPSLIWIAGNLEKNILLKESIDTVIHAAPLWLLSKHLETLTAAGMRRLVAFSSTSMFTKTGSDNAYEHSMVLRWEESEHTIERFCQTKNIARTIVRPTLIYGTELKSEISTIAGWIKRFRFFPYLPPANGLRQPVHADDLAQAVELILLKPHTAGHAYNLSGSEVIAYREMIKKIGYAMGKPFRLIPLPFLPIFLEFIGKICFQPQLNVQVAYRMNRDMTFDYSDARRDFGYTPRGFLIAGIMDLQ